MTFVILIIIFLVAISVAFVIVSYRAWQISKGFQVVTSNPLHKIHKISLKELERTILNLLKYYIQKIVLVIVKYWFILRIRVKKLIMEKWPKVYGFFEKKPIDPSLPLKPSFFTKALLESKVKIKRLKQKIHEDHDMEIGE